MDERAFRVALGRHIAKIRKAKGYSQDRLCLEAEFSRGTLSKIEKGMVNVQVLTLARIADVLDLPLPRLVDF